MLPERSPYWKASTRRPRAEPPPLTPEQRALVADHLPLAHWVLARYFGRFRRAPWWPDLTAAAHLGLCLAAARHRPGIEFTTFATPTIWGTCKNYARGTILQTRVSLPLSGECFGPSVSDYRFLPPPAAAADRERAALVRAALRDLDARDAEIVRARFGLDDGVERTLQEVGAAFAISRPRVQQILRRALPRVGRFLARGGA